MGRRIRVWREGGMYHGTLQCVGRQFLLKPDPKVNEIIGASLGRALEKFPVELHGLTTNINHLGFVFSVGFGQVKNVSAFLQMFANLTSRELNRYYERDGHFWAGRARIEEILDDSSAELMLAYDACNPVKDGIVESMSQWKGFSTNGALARGKRLEFSYFNRTKWWKTGSKKSKLQKKEYVEKVAIEITPLPGWRGLKESQRQTKFRHMIKNEEGRARNTRNAEGRAAMKDRVLEKKSPFDRPFRARKSTPHKLCHCETREAYREFRDSYRELKRAHMAASGYYRSGVSDVEFPPGTFRPPVVAAA